MNALKPQRMWIDGKTYTIKKFLKKNQKNSQREENVENSTPAEPGYEILSENNQFSTSFKTPNFYYYKMCKLPDFHLKTLEKNTQTTILHNKLSQKDCGWVISGNTTEQVIKAREELHSVIGLLRDQSTALQFISIPTLNDEIQRNFIKFKEAILQSEQPIKGMDESIFQTPLKLHLTLCVFTLLSEYEIAEAIQALADYKTHTLDPLIAKSGPLKIRLEGIDCMTSDRKNVHVLYANAKITNETSELTLQNIANDLADYLYEKGFICRHQENVKLHMTLLNTKYRNKDRSAEKKTQYKRWPKKIPFDATTILEQYKDYCFGECDFNAIHLSLMSTIDQNGFYKSLSVINI